MSSLSADKIRECKRMFMECCGRADDRDVYMAIRGDLVSDRRVIRRRGRKFVVSEVVILNPELVEACREAGIPYVVHVVGP